MVQTNRMITEINIMFLKHEPLVLDLYEDNTNINPNRWQPLAFDVFIDQAEMFIL